MIFKEDSKVKRTQTRGKRIRNRREHLNALLKAAGLATQINVTRAEFAWRGLSKERREEVLEKLNKKPENGEK
jgi:hypothetical protein